MLTRDEARRSRPTWRSCRDFALGFNVCLVSPYARLGRISDIGRVKSSETEIVYDLKSGHKIKQQIKNKHQTKTNTKQISNKNSNEHNVP
jgi:hypothetical protein